MDERLTHIDLFSGIGGFGLAAGWAGFETIAFCENEPYCQEVLKERFGGYVADSGQLGLQGTQPIGDAVCRKTRKKGGSQASRASGLYPPIIPNIRDFDGTKFRGATLLTGGFPCQPFSVAGKRGGKEDDRYLWPEMLRVIKDAQPTWIVAENVAGIVHMALGQVLSDLEGCGYDFPRDVEGYPIVPVIPASAVNAPHRRDRVWVIGYSKRGGCNGKEIPIFSGESRQADIDVARPTGWDIPWLEVASRFCVLDDELSGGLVGYLGTTEAHLKVRNLHRVKKLKALGNAIVPAVAFEILRGIAEIENGNKTS